MFNIVTVSKPAAQSLAQDGLSLLAPDALLQTLALTVPAAGVAEVQADRRVMSRAEPSE